MTIEDHELEVLIAGLETQADMTDADFEGVVHALEYLLPDKATEDLSPHRIRTADGAMLVADNAYPNWVVHIRGRANDRDGHWRCTLRESDSRDNDAYLGVGRSPVLAQAILAAVLRLSIMQGTNSRA